MNSLTFKSKSFLVVPVIALVLGASTIQAQPNQPPAPVVVSKVKKSQQTATLSVIGSVTPIRDSTIGSAVDGRVIKIFAEEGDYVQLNPQDADASESGDTGSGDTESGDADAGDAESGDAKEGDAEEGDADEGEDETIGQPLLQLRTGTLQIQIDTARVELSSRQQALIEAKETIPNEIEQLTASVAEAKARYDFAKRDFDRVKNLYAQGGIAEKERDLAVSAYETEAQRLVVARALLKRQTNTLDARLKQAEALVTLQEEEIRRLEDLKKKYTIRTPFDGYVVSRMAEVGQWVSQGDDVFRVVQLDPIEVTVNVPQSKIQSVQAGLDASVAEKKPFNAQIQVDSISRILEGEVRQIVPLADLRSRTFPVKIRVRNPRTDAGYLLKAGMLANASIAAGEVKDLLLVKKDALVLSVNQTQVYVAAKDPKSEMTTVRPVVVETGAAIDDWIEVKGLLQEGDIVVIEGNERLRPGQAVRIVKEKR